MPSMFMIKKEVSESFIKRIASFCFRINYRIDWLIGFSKYYYAKEGNSEKKLIGKWSGTEKIINQPRNPLEQTSKVSPTKNLFSKREITSKMMCLNLKQIIITISLN